jgi:hypothetical protein
MPTTINGDTGITFPNASVQSVAVSQATPFAVTASAIGGAEIQLPEATNNGVSYVAFKAPNSLAGITEWTLPAADGTNGQYLQTNGTGQLTFATVPATVPGGTTGQIQFNNAGVFGGVTAVPVANGGTGATTLTANNVLLGNGTSALQAVAPGTAGNLLTSNGTTWTSAAAPAGSMVLLASVAPTAAANVDFLNTFTSDYDAYFITLQSILPATAGQTLNMRVAVGGTAQSSANTYRSGTPGIVSVAFNSTSAELLLGSGTLDATGNGFTASVYLYNANGTGWKFGDISFIYQSPGGSTILSQSGMWAYSGSSALSGVRFLFSGGSNFAAQGRIRVYGFRNT